MALKSILNRSWKAVSDASTAYGLLPAALAAYLGAFASAILTLISGLLQGIPFIWVIVATLAALGYAFWALNQINTWHFEQGVENKIIHHNIRFGTNPELSGDNSALLIGFEVHNRAKFPLDIYVDDIETSLGGNFPPRKPFQNRRFSVPAFGMGWFQDYFIEIPRTLFGTVVEGSLRYRVKYGRNDSLNFIEQRAYNIFVKIDATGRFEHASWNEIHIPPAA